MKRFIVLIAVTSIAGCTTLRPIEGTPTQLQQRISSGELLKTGDRVAIVTTDAKWHQFSVTGLSAGLIEGRAESVPVDQVAALEKREFSRAKTLILVAGIVLAVGAGIAIVAANATPAFAL